MHPLTAFAMSATNLPEKLSANLLTLSLKKTGFFSSLYQAAFGDENWRLYLEGIKNTTIMTLLALLMGITIGVLVALVNNQPHSYLEGIKAPVAPGRFAWLRRIVRYIPFKPISQVYVTVIRGTPVILQLLIIYYIVFAKAPREARVLIASLAFGINSGAYVSEIIRGGIQSIDKGQMEAGRSLGLTHGQSMRLIVLPQAVRNILPSLFNELIALLKETSVASYVSIVDITFAGDSIRGRDFGLAPLLITAIIYLVLVYLITRVQKRVERRMATVD